MVKSVKRINGMGMDIFASMDPKHLSINDFSYHLPDERIAIYPIQERDQSKLLIYKDGSINEDVYLNLDRHLPEHTHLVFNQTRVMEARLIFQKPTGGIIEVFCLEPHDRYPDITTAMAQTGRVWWKCMIGGASKWKHGMVLTKAAGDLQVEALIIERVSGAFIIELRWNHEQLSFAEVLHKTGAVPLPPYLNRAAEERDRERYQTIYARDEGSVAAPTAGLHFTEALFQRLQENNISRSFVTLHVGAGTFKPVSSAQLGDHDMHAEWIDVERSFIEELLLKLGSPVVAVGTTSLRTIESLYWLGCKVARNKGDVTGISQWDPYELDEPVSPHEALAALIEQLKQSGQERLITKTKIIIAPGYKLRIADGLITNFHQPKSTLLLLIAAIVGNDWKRIYSYAMEHGYRFLSYGDGSLLWK